jgi:hypothetical protein
VSYSIHQVPGRLRINSPILYRNAESASHAQQCLDTRTGILSAKVSPLTGSITIYYNSRVTSAVQIMNYLTEGGFISEDAAPAAHGFSKIRLLAPDKGVWLVANVVINLIFKSVVDSSVGLLVGKVSI